MSDEGNEIVRRPNEPFLKCLTCSLCKDLFNDATTIIDCLHTFCRKCIYDKITTEGLKNCPVCNRSLGTMPLNKLRTDHHLGRLKTLIFGFETDKPNSTVATQAIPRARLEEQPPKTPTVARRKYQRRKNVAQKAQNVPKNLSSSKQKSIVLEDENQPEKQDLVEVVAKTFANSNISPSTIVQGSVVESFPPEVDLINGQGQPDKSGGQVVSQNKQSKLKGKNKVTHNNNNSQPSSELRPSQTRGQENQIEVVLALPAPNLIDLNREPLEAVNPVWFSLVASENQGVAEPLPQITPQYLRVKDGTVPVSAVKKYLAQKLNLANEEEIEVTLRGQPLISTLVLDDLVDQWIQKAPSSEETIATIGSSAEEFVMVSGYGRKIVPQ